MTIPQFQRRFVWRESQTKLLVDSISRAYPIGSLLLLNKKPELPLASRSIEAEIRTDDDAAAPLEAIEDMPSVEFYILDGQQRTTSIARVFLNSHPRHLFYFDLKKILEVHQEENPSWIVTRRRGKTAPDRKDNNRLLRADLTLDQNKTEVYVSEYIEDSGDFPQFEQDKNAGRGAAAKIKGIFETIRNYKVPVVQLERDNGVESICRVFETINSTGTRLGTFDLAVARFYPNPDLRSMWEESQERWPILASFAVDGDRVLQVMYLMFTARERRYADPSRGNLLSLKPEIVRQEWQNASESLAEALKWARGQGARPQTLPNINIVTAMAGVLRTPEGRNGWPDSDFIRRWYFSKSLQAGASQASNYRIGQDFSALHRFVKGEGQPDVPTVQLSLDTVQGIRHTDVRYKALLNVLAMTVREDLITGERFDTAEPRFGAVNSEATGGLNVVDIHDHHLFPRNASKRHDIPRQMLDSICNRVPVLAATNLKLGEGYPSDYLARLANRAAAEGRLSGVLRRLSDYMIPTPNPTEPNDSDWAEFYSVDRFPEFVRLRSELIVNRVREIVGDVLSSSPIEGDDEVEGEATLL